MALDLLAYAKGAEAAQQQNWRDVLNEMKLEADRETLRQSQELFPTTLGTAQERLRQSQELFPTTLGTAQERLRQIQELFPTTLGTAQENLRQSRTTYDIGLPVAQAGAQDWIAQREGNLRGADFQVGLSSALTDIPREQQPEYIANAALARLRNLGTRPGDAQEAQAITRYLGNIASEYAKAGDQAGLNQIMRAIPGADAGARLANISKWSNPQTALDPVNIAAAGGRIMPDGKVEFGGQQMSPVQFAMMQREFAANPMANVLPGMQQLFLQQQRNPALQQLADRYKALGYDVYVDPVSQQIIPLPMARTGVAPQSNVPPPANMPIPELQFGAVPVAAPAPPGVAPVAARPGVAPVAARPGAAPLNAKQVEARNDLAALTGQMRERLTDTVPGSPTYNRIIADIAEAERQLTALGAAPAASAPLAAPAAPAPLAVPAQIGGPPVATVIATPGAIPYTPTPAAPTAGQPFSDLQIWQTMKQGGIASLNSTLLGPRPAYNPRKPGSMAARRAYDAKVQALTATVKQLLSDPARRAAVIAATGGQQGFLPMNSPVVTAPPSAQPMGVAQSFPVVPQ